VSWKLRNRNIPSGRTFFFQLPIIRKIERILSFLLSSFLFLVWPRLLTHCRWRRLWLHLITLKWHYALSHTRAHSHTRTLTHTLTHTQSVGLFGKRIGPKQRPRPDNTQHSQETDTHVLAGMRTRNPSKRAATDPRLRPSGHQEYFRKWKIFTAIKICFSVRQSFSRARRAIWANYPTGRDVREFKM